MNEKPIVSELSIKGTSKKSSFATKAISRSTLKELTEKVE